MPASCVFHDALIGASLAAWAISAVARMTAPRAAAAGRSRRSSGGATARVAEAPFTVSAAAIRSLIRCSHLRSTCCCSAPRYRCSRFVSGRSHGGCTPGSLACRRRPPRHPRCPSILSFGSWERAVSSLVSRSTLPRFLIWDPLGSRSTLPCPRRRQRPHQPPHQRARRRTSRRRPGSLANHHRSQNGLCSLSPPKTALSPLCRRRRPSSPRSERRLGRRLEHRLAPLPTCSSCPLSPRSSRRMIPCCSRCCDCASVPPASSH